jgi:hypothetical protein
MLVPLSIFGTDLKKNFFDETEYDVNKRQEFMSRYGTEASFQFWPQGRTLTPSCELCPLWVKILWSPLHSSKQYIESLTWEEYSRTFIYIGVYLHTLDTVVQSYLFDVIFR